MKFALFKRLQRSWPLLIAGMVAMFCMDSILQRIMGRPTTVGGLVVLVMLAGALAGAAISVLAIIWRWFRR